MLGTCLTSDDFTNINTHTHLQQMTNQDNPVKVGLLKTLQ